ncbi:MAG: YceH family protein [Thermoleophilaceae bacterium]
MAVQLLDEIELRVLGCLIEKQRTTPEQYPLTLNALRLACNQATNREPAMELDESQVRAAAQSLGARGYARLATGPGSRTAKYRQLFGEALDLMPAEISLLGVLMLRGPQTVAELKTRTERLHRFADAGEVEATLRRLGERELVHNVGKGPGQSAERWAHLVGRGSTDETTPAAPAAVPAPAPAPGNVEQRVARLESRLDELERQLAERGVLQ